MAAVPLAAAAALTLWLRAEPSPSRDLASTLAIQVGEYTSPTDVLLEAYGAGMYTTVPSIGCDDSVLGCPRVDSAGSSHSQRQVSRGARA